MKYPTQTQVNDFVYLNETQQSMNAIKTAFTELLTVEQVVTASLFNTDIYKQTQKVLKSMRALVAQVDKGVLDLKKIQESSTSITDLCKLILKAKESNPLISVDLIIAITKATSEVNRALKIAQEALK